MIAQYDSPFGDEVVTIVYVVALLVLVAVTILVMAMLASVIARLWGYFRRR